MPKTQILNLDPPTELTFKGPFTRFVTSHLRLSNPNDQSVFFKIKTTAPKFYCVKPNSGIVKPSETVTVTVTLQPVSEDDRSRHKFMIQTAFGDDKVPVDSFWKDVDAEEVFDTKLRVTFVKPDGTADEPAVVAKDASQVGAASPASTASVHSGGDKSYGDVASPVSVASAGHHHVASGGSGGATPSRDLQRELQKEVELRKMYQDEKSKLERENYSLLDKLDKLARNAANNVGADGLPLFHVILVAIFALLLGIIFGKIIF